eukprot:9477136-Pyramimonas_sp.AAC.1
MAECVSVSGSDILGTSVPVTPLCLARARCCTVIVSRPLVPWGPRDSRPLASSRRYRPPIWPRML